MQGVLLHSQIMILDCSWQTTKLNICGQLWVHGIKFSSFEVDSLSTGLLEQHYEGRPILMHSIELHPISSSLLPYFLILL